MTVDDLKELRWLDRRIEKIYERIAHLRAAREGASSWSFGRVGGRSGPKDQMGEYAAELEQLETELTARAIELERKRLNAERAIDGLGPKHRQVLQLYYIDNLPSWIAVSEETGYEENYCRQLRNEAIRLLA